MPLILRCPLGALILFCLLIAVLPTAARSQVDPSEQAVFESMPTLTGQVLDAKGQCVDGADVYLLHNPNGSYTLPVKPLNVQTSSDGTFVFEQVAEGGYRIWAETENATSLIAKLRGRRVKILTEISEDAGKGDVEIPTQTEQEPLTIQLHSGCGFDISVSDSQGRPIEGADVSFGWTDIDRHYATTSDGVARIRGLAQDNWFVVVRADGKAAEWFKTSKQDLGTVLPLDFQLKPGGSLQVKLVDEAGTPVPDAQVHVNLASRSMTPNYTPSGTRTDAAGVVLCHHLPLDKPIRVHAVKDGYDYVHSELTITSDEQVQDAKLLLKKKPYGGDVLVRVLDSDGNPIEGAELFNQGSSSRDLRRVKTNADGEALLEDVFKSYAGVVIVAKARGFVAQEAQATPGTADNPGNLQFALQPGNTLRGRITNPAGEPMPKLRVYYDRGENGDLKGGRVDTDDDGRFELTGLGAEVLFTVYTPPEYAPIQKIVLRTDLDELMELELVPAGLLRVRAVDAESKEAIPAFNVRVGFCEQMQAGDLSPKSMLASLTEDGVNIQGDAQEYRLDNQVAGTAFKVIVSAAGYEQTTVDRMVAESADGAQCVDVLLYKEDMRDYQTIAGRILDADRQPIVGASVRLLNGRAIPKPRIPLPGLPNPAQSGWRFYHWGLLERDDIENRDQCEQVLKAVSDENGHFRFAKVKRDTPWLELYYTGERIPSQRYSNLRDYTEAELQALELIAERPCELSVVVDRELYPQAAQLNLSADGWNDGLNSIKMPFAYTYRELEEENVFANIPAGTYQISVMSENIPLGNGGFTTKTLTSKSFTLEPGQELKISF